MQPKIAYIDLETAPNLGFVWGMWEQNVIDFKKHWFILSFAVKWAHEKKIRTYALPDYKRYSKSKDDDFELVRDLWGDFDEADIIIAHNGDRFDIRKAAARFVAHRLGPPSPFKTIDTLKIARKHFKFDSNKLDDLGNYLGVGRKLPHTGKHLWLGCYNGDQKAWGLMRKYNAQDVALLDRVHLRLRPFATNYPNLNFYTKKNACPYCQSSNIQYRGWHTTRTSKKARIHCQDCGAWSTHHKRFRSNTTHVTIK